MAFLCTLLVWIMALANAQDGSAWSATWERLGQLEGLEKGSVRAQELAIALRSVEQAAAPGARRSILGAHLGRLEGSGEAINLEGVSLQGLSGHESWLLAEVLPTSPLKAETVLNGLRLTETLNTKEINLAWRSAAAEAGALRFAQGARPIQENLHGRLGAAWTAIHLCLTLMRLGDITELNRVMQQAIQQEEAAGRSSAELWSQWGLALLGNGNEQRARGHLGRALSRGSSNAALILGRLDLQQGRLKEARASFRPSLLTPKPSAWALRGWGATLLPEALTNPAGSQPSATQD